MTQGGSGCLRRGHLGNGPDRSGGGFWGLEADGLGNLLFERAARAGLKRQSNETGKNIECRGQRGGKSLRAQ